MRPRQAVAEDLAPLARLWWQGWTDAHAAISPPALVRLRTRESFSERMAAALPGVRVIGPAAAPVGFHLIKGDELNQFYVADPARGTGVAAALMMDAEACMAAQGVEIAWLACAVGNPRAARFYEKSGWSSIGVHRHLAETSSGPIPLDVWRYEKRLEVA